MSGTAGMGSRPGSGQPGGPARPLPPAREYALVLGLGAAGAALVLLAVRQGWARVITTAAGPLPGGAVLVHGQDLVPMAAGLAVAGLASLVAVIATRRLARRLVGVVLAGLGVATAATLSLRVTAAAVRAAAVAQAGSVTGGGTTGGSGTPVPGAAAPGLQAAGRVAMAALPWRWVALVGAVAMIAAGVLVTWRGARWPAMSSRYEQRRAGPVTAADPATMWESLTAGADPTEDGPAGPRPPPGRAG